MMPGQPIPQPMGPQQQGAQPVTIDAVVQLLRDERMRGFRIDIETDSLVEADQSQERQDATELVTSIGSFFKEFGPVVQTMPPLAPMAAQLLQFAVRRYKVGAELEETIEKSMAEVVQHLANPPPPQSNPEDQAKLQITQAKGQAEIGKANASLQATQTKAQAEADKAQLETYHAKIQHETTVRLAVEKATLEKEAMLLDAEIKKRASDREHELHQLKLAHEQQAHEHKMQQADQQHEHSLTTAKATHEMDIEKKYPDSKIEGKIKDHVKKDEETRVAAHKKDQADRHARLEKLFSTIAKAVTAPKKVVRDANGDFRVEHS